MYGLKEEKRERFQFDLEKKIKGNLTHQKKIQTQIEERVGEIKKKLREGQNEKEFDQLGVLLHGYTALQKILKKAAK